MFGHYTMTVESLTRSVPSAAGSPAGGPSAILCPAMRKILIAASVIAASLFAAGCATDAGYIWKETGPFLQYSSGSRDIDSLLKDPHTTPDVRALLVAVKDIKRFAIEKIGLADNANYTRFKEVDRDYLVSVVQACDSVSFTPYQWSYPFLGSLPYRGFYDPADAAAEGERLKKAGYDVIVRKVDAFSTLGFFKDPVYSFMERYSTYELANLVIHEQTHATIFLKDQPQFNEELASFVGDQGALEFLRFTYGADSSQLRDAVLLQADSELFLDFLKELKEALNAVYTGPLSRDEKLIEKGGIIAEYQKRFSAEYQPRFATSGYREAKDLPLNNAYISLYNLYTDDIPLLRRYEQQKCGESLSLFMRQVRQLSRAPGGMAQKLKNELDGGP
jgi:predicted aminopeptidase